MLKVYVVDHSELVRERLIDMVSEIEGVEVVGETGDLREAEASIGELRPDAVMFDIRIPDGNGITLFRLSEGPSAPRAVTAWEMRPSHGPR